MRIKLTILLTLIFSLLINVSIVFAGNEGTLPGGSTITGAGDACSQAGTPCANAQICHPLGLNSNKCITKVNKKCTSDADCVIESGDIGKCDKEYCYLGDASLAEWNKTDASKCDSKDGDICYHTAGLADSEEECKEKAGIHKNDFKVSKWNSSTKVCFLNDIAYAKYKSTSGDVPSIYEEINPPKNAIHIPGLDFASLTSTLDANGYIYMPWIGQYASAVYKFAMVAVSIIAVLMIMIQGIKIMMGQGFESIEKWDKGTGSKQSKQMAYQKIGKVVIGLIIAWSSYTILFMINPALVEFKSLKVKYVERDPFEELAESDENETTDELVINAEKACSTVAECEALCKTEKSKWPTATKGMASPSDLVKFSSYSNIKARSSHIIDPKVNSALASVNTALSAQGYKLNIISAYRPLSDQIQKVCDKIKLNKSSEIGKIVAWPGGSNHGKGIAIDVHLVVKGQDLGGSSMTQELIDDLEEIMRKGGFVRYCKEWWHFEIGTAGSSCRPSSLSSYCTRPYVKSCK